MHLSLKKILQLVGWLLLCYRLSALVTGVFS